MRFALMVVLVAATACDGTSVGGAPSAAVLLPSIALQVTEQGEFGAFAPWTARTESGELFQIDARAGIVQFAPDGSQRRLIGKMGEGPGEYRSLSGGGVLPGDSLLAVVDANRSRVMLFSVESGAFRREVLMSSTQVAGQHWHFDTSGALIPIALGIPAFLRWDAATDSLKVWGEPTEFRRNSNMASMTSGEPSAIPDGNGWLVFLPGESTLVRYDSTGTISGRVPLPRVGRRGEPLEAAALLKQAGAEGKFLSPASMAMGIHRLADGKVLLIHLDVEGKRNGQRVELTQMQWWATIYAPDLQTACVDQPVPFTTQELSRVLFAGDTVMTLSRSVEDAGEVRSELQRVSFDLSKCTWVPVVAEEK